MKTEKFKNLYFFHLKSKIKAGDGIDNGEYPFYTSSEKLTKTINSSQLNTSALVLGTGGKASIHFANGRFSVSTDCLVASSKQEYVNIKFTYYYLFGNLHLLERGFKGAGLKHISKKYIENLDIPILPIETQNKIVAILDKAGSLITKREASILMLDELLYATFLDKFGDPVINPKKWPIKSFSKIGEFKSGGTPSKDNSSYWSGDFPWVSPKDMKAAYIYDSIDHISEDVFLETSLKKIEPDNLLIVVRGMILAHSFPIAINKVAVAINQDMKVITPSSSFKSEYILICLKIMENWVLQYVSTAAHGTKKLTSESLKKILLPCPPIENQNEFIEITTKVNSVKARLLKEYANAKSLMASILQKSFNGQLNFNIDFELDALIKEISLNKKDNDLSKISGDIAYLQRLVDKINNQEFKEKDLYDKAKHGVFQLMAVKEEERKVIQEYNENSKSIKLALK